jgi:UDP-N-acetylmuramyl pentapeptide phosphotransferase/UDP-N-acetylglucosamine-1-phosphate transferase
MFINFFKDIGIKSNDVHKEKKQLVPMGGGICVLLGLLSGIFLYIAIKTFIVKDSAGFLSFSAQWLQYY